MTKLITQLAFILLSLNLSAQNAASFFADADAFFAEHVSDGKVDYAAVKQDARLNQFVQEIANFDYSTLDKKQKKAYLINAYNLLVISQIIDKYPIASVQETGAFFERESIYVAGKKYSLNKFEKEEILKPFNDARLHFVLVCGAKGCPPITNFAYTPENLNEQLDVQTRKSLNDPSFISVSGNQVNISKIFEWYATDFGSNKMTRFNFINGFRNTRIPSSAKFKYIDYDWSINDTTKPAGASVNNSGAANSARYVVSSTIPKGTVELKNFNNLYTQRSSRDQEFGTRENFFTSTLSALYGVNKRFNAGFELKYRRVTNTPFPSSPLSVFGGNEEIFSERSGITGIGPKIRWAPTAALPNFSIQSTLQFGVGEDLKGEQGTGPFIDWQGVISNTQFFNDISIGTRFSLFTEIDLLFEDLGNAEEGFQNRFTTPATLIFSYFPNQKTTIYTLGGYAPTWTGDFSYFYQYGLGFKYQFSPNFELETLITDFNSNFLTDGNQQAATFNLGIRYNIQ